jgi:hypothetical protein
MKILVKIPTRSRPEQFFKVLDGYIFRQKTKDVTYLISLDQDDIMSDSSNILKLSRYGNVFYNVGYSATKVQAYNRDIHLVKDWDIIVVASDDMICVAEGWDETIQKEMKEWFPNTDGVLHHNDGYVKERLNTLPILGRKYFDRFGYVYNPEYKSLWCDNEFMEVAEILLRQKYFDTILFKHEHPANNSQVKSDSLMQRNESMYWSDKEVYDKRKSYNFGL